MSNFNIFSLDTFMIFYIMHCKFIIEVVFSCIALFLYSIKWNMQRSTAISLVLNWMIHLSNLIFIFRVHRCSHSIGVCVKHFYNVLYVLPLHTTYLSNVNLWHVLWLHFFKLQSICHNCPCFYCQENYFLELY